MPLYYFGGNDGMDGGATSPKVDEVDHVGNWWPRAMHGAIAEEGRSRTSLYPKGINAPQHLHIHV